MSFCKPYVIVRDEKSVGPYPDYYATQVGKLYNFPSFTGAGCKIGLIQFGGGYTHDDMGTYFLSVGLPSPTIIDVSVDGATNTPGDSSQDEVTLDIQVSMSIAPSATCYVYFAPNTADGWLHAFQQAISDGMDVLSVSWGARELGPAWSSSEMEAQEDVFSTATMPIFTCAGDDGSTDGGTGLNVDYPGSSPQTISCGGTMLIADVLSNTIQSEIVWNSGGGKATGGGFSAFFDRPAYQFLIGYPLYGTQRGVPDIAGDADPRTGYNIYSNSTWKVVGGTSPVAPLMAGLYCLFKEAVSPDFSLEYNSVQLLNFFYQFPFAFRDITVGNNGDFSAGVRWDPCTGLGVPFGLYLLDDLDTLLNCLDQF